MMTQSRGFSRWWPLAGGLFLVLAAGPAAAQALASSAAMDLADAVRTAVHTHPSVRSAEQQQLQAGEGVSAARSGYLPQVKLGIDSQNTNYDNTSYEGERNVHTAKLTVSQMLWDFGKTRHAVGRARAAVRAGEAQVQLSTDQVANATAQAWVEAHLQQALAQIAAEQLAAVEHLAALVDERVNKGAATRSDREQARSRVEAARSQLLAAQAEQRRAALNLMHLTSAQAPVAIRGELPAWLDDAVCAQAPVPSEAPSVRLAEAKRDQAEADVAAARAQRLPTLSLDGSLGHALNDRSRLYGRYENTSSVGLNLSMPLYEGGGLQARERAARYQLGAAEEAAAQARLEMRQGLADARAQAEGWQQRAPVLQARVESIHATRDLYQQQYLQLGTRSLLDLLNSEQEYQNARIEQARGEHEQAQLELQCLFYAGRLREAFGLEAAEPLAGNLP